jgi:hypothetical protein
MGSKELEVCNEIKSFNDTVNAHLTFFVQCMSLIIYIYLRGIARIMYTK